MDVSCWGNTMVCVLTLLYLGYPAVRVCVCVCVNSLGSAGPVKQPGWVTTSEVKKFSVVFVIFKCYHIIKFIIRIAIQSKFVKIITKTLGDLMKAIRQVSNAFIKSEKNEVIPNYSYHDNAKVCSSVWFFVYVCVFVSLSVFYVFFSVCECVCVCMYVYGKQNIHNVKMPLLV